MVTLLYRILEQILRYDTVIRRTWVTATGNNNAFGQTAADRDMVTFDSL